MRSLGLRYWTTKTHSAAIVDIWWWCFVSSAGLGLGRHSHCLALLGPTTGAGASRFGAAPARLLSPLMCSLPICIWRYTTYVTSRCPGLRRVLLWQRTGMPASTLPVLIYETLEVGRRWRGVTDLLPMVFVQWLDIAYLHGLFLTTVSTRYASTVSMYLSPVAEPGYFKG
jgi:hypothetical protein